jgi:hypothetical protein
MDPLPEIAIGIAVYAVHPARDDLAIQNNRVPARKVERKRKSIIVPRMGASRPVRVKL